MDKQKEEELLSEFIEREKDKLRGGSGDDEYYCNQIVEYINKQRKLWLELIKFIKLKMEAPNFSQA